MVDFPWHIRLVAMQGFLEMKASKHRMRENESSTLWCLSLSVKKSCKTSCKFTSCHTKGRLYHACSSILPKHEMLTSFSSFSRLPRSRVFVICRSILLVPALDCKKSSRLMTKNVFKTCTNAVWPKRLMDLSWVTNSKVTSSVSLEETTSKGSPCVKVF